MSGCRVISSCLRMPCGIMSDPYAKWKQPFWCQCAVIWLPKTQQDTALVLAKLMLPFVMRTIIYASCSLDIKNGWHFRQPGRMPRHAEVRDWRRCPMCRSQVERRQHNNHMVCWACGLSFCGCCRANLRQEGGKHFSASKSGASAGRCRQHTRN